MPRREDLETILVLGSGPIKIGQAAEFDFSGSQAVQALREDGYKVILVNSNPATIQNDPEMADKVYIEPLLPDTIRRILEIERPDRGCYINVKAIDKNTRSVFSLPSAQLPPRAQGCPV